MGSRLDGADAGEEEEEEWDPAAETLPGQAQQKGKGKGKQKEADPASAAVTEDGNDGESKPHPWQAVWSEEKNGAFGTVRPLPQSHCKSYCVQTGCKLGELMHELFRQLRTSR